MIILQASTGAPDWMQPFIAVALMAVVVAAVAAVVSSSLRSRCPACRSRVRRGATVCPACRSPI